MKRDFGVRRTHLRGQKSVENDIGLVLMSMNLVKLGKMIAQFSAKYIENIKIRLQNFELFKILESNYFLGARNH